MRLEFADYPVKEIQFGGETAYSDGTLRVNKEELKALVLSDKRVKVADLDVAFPGEQTRIVNTRDVVEPRIKVSGPGCVFPGIMGPVQTVGEGRTNRLSGMAVITCAEYQPTIITGSGSGSTAIVDMWGPASKLSPLGSTVNLILSLKLADGINELEAHNTIQMAEFKVAHRLAETTKNKTPKNTDIFDLSKTDASLPKVVYILSACSFRIGVHDPHSRLALYGLSVEESLPTFIHPNEILDGAVTTDVRKGRSNGPSTWGFMNNPIVFGLLREHGKRVNFMGVVLQRTRFLSEFGKSVTAETTSQLIKLIGADGAISSRTSPSGNNMVDVMLTLQACERKGIKTVTVSPEWGGRDGTETPLVFHLPEANAIVSTCSMDMTIKVPVPKKVIGLIDNKLITIAGGGQPDSPWEELVLDNLTSITEGLDWFGRMGYTCKVY